MEHRIWEATQECCSCGSRNQVAPASHPRAQVSLDGEREIKKASEKSPEQSREGPCDSTHIFSVLWANSRLQVGATWLCAG